MVITIINLFEDMSTGDIAREKVGKRIFVGMSNHGILLCIFDINS